MKKVVLKNFTIFIGKLQTGNFIKKRLQHRCFPLNIAKFLTATEQWWATGSELTLLLSSDNLLTGYE